MQIKKINILCAFYLTLGTLVVFSNGCTNTQTTKTSIPRLEQQSTKPKLVKEIASSTSDIKATTSKADYLSIYIDASGNTPEETSLAENIAKNLSGVIKEAKNIKLLFDPESAHVFLSITPTLKTIDIAGEYYRMGCSVDLAMYPVKNENIYGDNDILAQKKITLQDGRKLGRDAAIQQFIDPASKESFQWVTNSMERIAASKIGVELVTFQLTSSSMKDNKISSLVQAVANKLSNMESEKEIISFEHVDQDSAAKTCTFKIVYEKEKFKRIGFINAINQKF